MTDEKKTRKKSEAQGERLNILVLGCLHSQLARLPDAKTRLRVLNYMLVQINDEATLERANAIASRPFATVNGVPKQTPMFDNLDE